MTIRQEAESIIRKQMKLKDNERCIPASYCLYDVMEMLMTTIGKGQFDKHHARFEGYKQGVRGPIKF